MRKRILTILALLLLLGAAWLANGLFGNPISSLLIRRSAENHIRAVYSDLDLILEDVGYSFKDGKYHAFIVSGSSQDTHFTLYYNGLGRLIADTYQNHVASGWNTVHRLDTAYQQQADPVIHSLPYDVPIGFFQLNYIFPEESPSSIPALRVWELEPDKEYDISALGAEYGQLILYVAVEELSPAAASEILLTINDLLAEVPFYSLDLTLQATDNSGELYLRNFLRSEISSDGLEEKVLRNQQQIEDAYAQMDKELPVGVTLQAAFLDDGTVELTCGEDMLTFTLGNFPEEDTPLGAARIEVLFPGAVRAVFGDTSILFLQEGAEPSGVSANLIWGHVTQSYGAYFAVFPEAPSPELQRSLEEQGMNLLIPSQDGTVTATSDGTEVYVTWTSSASFPAMSDTQE